MPGRHLVVLVLLLAITSCTPAREPTRPEPTRPDPTRPDPTGAALFRGPQPWTSDVSAAPASPRSDAITAALRRAGGWGNGDVLQVDFSLPVLVAGPDTLRTTVTARDGDYCFGGPACDPVPAEIPVPGNAHLEGSDDLTCDVSVDDCHLLVVDPANRRLHEIYQGNRDGDRLTATGLVTWDLDRTYTDELRGPQCTSADASGLPIAALTPTADEVAAGRIDHALRFTLPNDRIRAGVYVPPATHAGGPENADPDAPPSGTHLRLRPDADLGAYTEPQRVVLRALQTHGMYLVDGGEITLTFADDRTAAARWADLGIESRTFADLRVEDFEVIDHGPEVPLTYECARG